jgi:anti-sigma factor RsiW
MKLLTCAAVNRRLEAFYDGELPVAETIAVETHLQQCPPCARRLRELSDVGDLLRAAAAPAPADDWTGLEPGVMSRMRAEAYESLPARTARLFEDMHLVWIGLAAAAATIVCGTIVLSMLSFASPERRDSLAGVIAVTTALPGSNQNPVWFDNRFSVPSVAGPGDGVMRAALIRGEQDDLMLPLSVVVTREGELQDIAVLTHDHDQRDVTSILDAISQTRLEPAQQGGAPVAVGLVWLLAHTTVKGKISS